MDDTFLLEKEGSTRFINMEFKKIISLLSTIIFLTSCQNVSSFSSESNSSSREISSSSNQTSSTVVSTTNSSTASSNKESNSFIAYKYTFEGKQFVYRDLSKTATFSENATGISLTSFGEASQDEFVVIPNNFNGKPITRISIKRNDAHPIRNDIKIVIPKSITKISIQPTLIKPSLLFNGTLDDYLDIPHDVFEYSFASFDLYLLNNKNYEFLRDLVISDDYFEIPDNAFAYCNIETVSLPSMINRIGNKAFKNCTKLKSIQFSEGLQTIGSEAFSYCTNLTSLVLPSTIKTMSGGFWYCMNLLSVEYNSNSLNMLNKIGMDPFYNCERIFRMVNHGNSDPSWFNQHHSVQVTEENADYEIIDYEHFTFSRVGDVYTLLSYSGTDEDIYLPENVIHGQITIDNYHIGQGAFFFEQLHYLLDKNIGYNYYSHTPIIKSIHVPANILSIGTKAFLHCTLYDNNECSLKEIYFDFDSETLSSLLGNYINFPNTTNVYCKENGQYILFHDGQQ